MIKLIASDMDGTLLNSHSEISEENLKAIKIAQDKGVHFTIVTGRDYSMVKPFIDEHDLNCEAILMNGAEYRDKDGNIVENIAIDNEKVREIINILNSKNMWMDIYTEKGNYVTTTKEEAIEINMGVIKAFNKDISDEKALELTMEYLKQTNPIFIDSADEVLAEDATVYKIMAFYNNIEYMDNLKKEIYELGGVSVASTFRNNIEINNIRAQKGIILADVIKKMGIEKDEVIVLGDSYNDYSMFTEFNHSFAMANAVEEIKEIATYITDTNDNAGVAKAIYKAMEI